MAVADLAALTGRHVGTSRWFEIDQAMIDAYAELVEDRQFIHIDPDRAGATPFGGTVAHGFLTLSLLSAMAYDALPDLDGMAMSVNYGFDHLRFIAPVRAGSRVRGVFALDALEERKPGEITLTWGVTVEIEGKPKPALAARWINRYYLE